MEIMEITERKLDSDRVKKNLASDRVLVLAKIEGKHILSTSGKPDNRLFSGENKLHAIFDPERSMWYLKFDSGLLPEAFKQYFTTFAVLLKFVKQYYEKRNVLVKEVID